MVIIIIFFIVVVVVVFVVGAGLSAREFQVVGCKSCFSATNYNINVEVDTSLS